MTGKNGEAILVTQLTRPPTPRTRYNDLLSAQDLIMATTQTGPQSYDVPQKAFHWLTAALTAAQFVIAWTMTDPPEGSPPIGLMNLHLSVGSTILMLTIMRLLWRLTHAVPAPPRDIPRWQQAASRATHLSFYVILIAMPIAGWTWASAKGWPVTLFGIVRLPALTTPGNGLGEIAGEIHELLGIALLALLALHVAAALRHHFLKDGILARMLPGSSTRTNAA